MWGEEVPGYREERRTSTPGRETETFVALKVFVDNWQWARVPFYIRAGRGSPRRRRRSPSSSHSSPHTPSPATTPRASSRTSSSFVSNQKRTSP